MVNKNFAALQGYYTIYLTHHLNFCTEKLPAAKVLSKIVLAALSSSATTPNRTQWRSTALPSVFPLSYIGILHAPLGPESQTYSCLPTCENLSCVCRPSYQLWLFASPSGGQLWGLSDVFLCFVHLRSSFTIYCDSVEKSTARPKNQALLLMGMRRALRDHSTAQDDDQLRIDHPDPALVQSINFPPISYTNDHMECWLH